MLERSIRLLGRGVRRARLTTPQIVLILLGCLAFLVSSVALGIIMLVVRLVSWAMRYMRRVRQP